MNILINLKSSVKSIENPFHGGNEYANRIVVELIKFNINVNQKHNLHFLYHSKKMADSNVIQYIEADKNSLMIENNKDGIAEIISFYHIQRLFDPLGNTLNTIKLNDIEIIYTIHGLRPIEMPTDINEFFLESKLKYILKIAFLAVYKKKQKKKFKTILLTTANSKKLVVVSEHTKNVIVSEFNINPDDINVFYSPEKIFPNVDKNDEEYFFKKNQSIKPKEYFLIVSSKRWIKNSYRAIKAFDDLIDKGLLNYKVVLTGANHKVTRLIKNKNMFCPLDYVEVKELEVLYKNAFAFVYPTLNEGFGYPPLEAMKYGTPVVSSSITSTPEVVGDAALLFNPFSIMELKARIVQIQEDVTLYESMRERGIDRHNLIKARQKSDLDLLVSAILS